MSEASGPEASGGGFRSAIQPVAAIAFFLTLALTSAASHSGTFDESAYVSAGYAGWRFGDFRLTSAHPPLAKLWVAAPLLAMDVRVDPGDGAWLEAHPWKFGRLFLYEWNDPQRLLLWARAANAVLAAGLILIVWAWTRLHFGHAAGSVALLLCVASPDLLAHGSLATTDLAVSAFVFASVIAFERLLERASPWRVFAAGTALGAALLSKHSALLLGPLLALLGLAHARLRDDAAHGRRLHAAWRALRLLALVCVIAYGWLWAGYRFRFEATAEPARTEPLHWRADAETASDLVAATGQRLRLARLLPEAYVHGLLDLLTRSQERRAFLLGRYSNEGWWYYFLVTFLLKTPVPLLILLGIALARPPESDDKRRLAAFVWLPVAAFALAALTSKVDIGHRYLLPIQPFLIVAAAGGSTRLLAAGTKARIALLLLGAWYVGGTALNHPHHLAYFNELGGGPSHGYRWLSDSNVDWGQDLKRLKRYMDAQRLDSVKLSYFGTAPPEAYGIRHELLPSVMRPIPERLTLLVRRGDVVVISATNLQGVYLPRVARRLMERFREKEPVARVGRSLFVYRADFDWLPRPDLAEELGWLDSAIASYREALRLDPNDANAQAYLERATERVRPRP